MCAVKLLRPPGCGAQPKLLKLDHVKATQAINMSLNAHIAMRQVRSGELSTWKGCSAANAARNALFCAQLAQHGMTGPSPVFEGKMGFFNQVTDQFDPQIEQWGEPSRGDYRILKSRTKMFPTNGELQTAVRAALQMRSEIAHPELIAAIRIHTTAIGFRILASDPQKWRPSTRETADHSLPYNVARAILDGEITPGSFSEAKISDSAAMKLMDRTTVDVDPALDAYYPELLPNRVTITLDTGQIIEREVLYGQGSVRTPMLDADFEDKFRRMATSWINAERQDDALAFVASLEKQTSYNALFEAMAFP